MADILLVAVNARFNHTNIAVRSIAYYINKPDEVTFGEWTINEPVLEILRGIAAYHPKVVLFSTYIWNIDIVRRVMREIPKVIPGCIVGAGGPEAGYRAREIFTEVTALDLVIAGEGEETTAELVRLYESIQKKAANDAVTAEKKRALFVARAGKIPGVFARVATGANCSSACGDTNGAADCSGAAKELHNYNDIRGGEYTVLFGGFRDVLPDLSVLPFPYPQITDPDNRIYYYESSRGCPFTCAYCMSSLDKVVRFMPLDRVFADLQRFLDARVKLVKFVDRTYNLQPERYIAIWKYILAHHNGYTMFHFEIEAEHLCDAALDFLHDVPAGVMQFEVGVQSTNPETLAAVHRSAATALLFEHVQRIPRTIHTHLDLIAGLPFENLESFGRSFDDVIGLVPDALQLGFLKVLAGTDMETYCASNGWKWMSDAPYEVLSTPYLSYEDIQFLKDVEVVLDAYWNAHNFDTVMKRLLEQNGGLWHFFYALVLFARSRDVFALPRKPLFWYELLVDFFTSAAQAGSIIFTASEIDELIKFDFLYTGKKGSFPLWCHRVYDKDAHRAALEKYTDLKSTRLAYSFSEYEVFRVNPLAPQKSVSGKTYPVLFLYPDPAAAPHIVTTVVLLSDNN